MQPEVMTTEWILFGAVMLGLLAIDLYVHRGGQGDSRRRAIQWSLIWIAAGLAFCGHIWMKFGGQEAQEYLAAYLIEKSLSLDNLFVFLIIFKSLKIPKNHQRTALSWGIFGALVFRAIFIFLGAAALERWEWVQYLFAAILFYAAFHAFREDPSEQKENRAVEWLSRHFPVSRKTDTHRFAFRENGNWVATPLLIAVLSLELTDVIFAVDSIPAAFSVTRNTYIIYSSNVFAILGLRALYLVLAHTIGELKYLHYGLAAVLAFAGAKMIVSTWIEIPPLVSVGIIAACIGVAAWASMRRRAGSPAGEQEPAAS